MARLTLKSSPVTLWCEALASAVSSRRGQAVAQLFNIEHVLSVLGREEIFSTKLAAFEAYCSLFKVDGVSLKPLMVALFKLLQERCRRPVPAMAAVVNHAIAAVNAWIDLYRSPEVSGNSNWMVSGLVTLLGVLDKAGVEADAQQDTTIDEAEECTGAGGDERFQSGALRQTENQQKVLNTIRQHIGKFRGDEARQAGYVVLMSESIQLCMTLGNIQMASAFLKTVESSYVDFSRIPRGPLVSFKYFLGKLYMQQDKFQKADEALTWSFSNCGKKKPELKRCIFECLTAVRLRMGKLPPRRLLEKYQLDHYMDVVRAMKNGDIRRFERTLATKTNVFIEEGTLLCAEKLKFIVYRTLFKRILEWARKELYEGKPVNVVPLGVFTAGFGWQMDEDDIAFDDEEMACITANLIKMGYVKGYIAWEHGKIVLSKQTPLPRLHSVQIS